MTRSTIIGTVFVAALFLLALAFSVTAFHRTPEQKVAPAASPEIAPAGEVAAEAATSPASMPSTASEEASEEARRGFLYGRVTADGGVIYEGRLRWGDGEEAFWGDYFNGSKDKNRWAGLAPPERLPKVRHSIEILGLQIAQRERPVELGRLFMQRFGDIARIEAHGRDVRVILKSGTVFDLNRLDASDFDDGVRVWDAQRGIVDLDSLRIRTIELLPTGRLAAAPTRLHGTVHTPQGDFTGFVQWNRTQCVGADELEAQTPDGDVRLRFDTIRTIARRLPDSAAGLPFGTIRTIANRYPEIAVVTLLDGREIEVYGAQEVGDGNSRGTYVDDPRYGRVLVSWDAFDRLDFSPGGSGPAYGDFPPGRPLTGSVTTRDGRRLAGRIVYDLDESETTETFDAPAKGVNYTIPFGMIASIVVPVHEEGADQHAKVTLHNGTELRPELEGDVGKGNAGMLIFVNGGERPEYVPWTEVAQVDLDRPPAMYPPIGGR